MNSNYRARRKIAVMRLFWAITLDFLGMYSTRPVQASAESCANDDLGL